MLEVLSCSRKVVPLHRNFRKEGALTFLLTLLIIKTVV